MNKLFSILIFACNHEEKIVKCFDMINNQNFYNYEIILICNKENKLLDILTQFSLKYNIKIIFTENYEIEQARNEALQFCHGRYILFMQENEDYSDNYLHECCKKVLISKNKLICTNTENSDMMETVFGKVYDGDLIRKNKIEFKEMVHSELDFNQQYMKYSNGTVYCEKATCKKNI